MDFVINVTNYTDIQTFHHYTIKTHIWSIKGPERLKSQKMNIVNETKYLEWLKQDVVIVTGSRINIWQD